jgi:hypothetical protein
MVRGPHIKTGNYTVVERKKEKIQDRSISKSQSSPHIANLLQLISIMVLALAGCFRNGDITTVRHTNRPVMHLAGQNHKEANKGGIKAQGRRGGVLGAHGHHQEEEGRKAQGEA